MQCVIDKFYKGQYDGDCACSFLPAKWLIELQCPAADYCQIWCNNARRIPIGEQERNKIAKESERDL